MLQNEIVMAAHRSIFLCLLLTVGSAQSQTMYVTDELVITLRTGPSTQNTVIDNLSSGDRIEILEQDEENGYARVRVTGSGEEGWVLSRFLVGAQTAALELSQTERELNSAASNIASLESELEAVRANLDTTQSKLTEFESNNTSLSRELSDIRSASANAIEMRDQNESLRRRNNGLAQEVEELTARTSALADRSTQNWFVVGALVLVAGIVIGLIAPSLRRKRRPDW